MGMHSTRAFIAKSLAVAWLSAGCTLLTSSSMTTEVTIGGPDGDRIVECRSESPITGDACIVWGERILDGLPVEAAAASRLILTDSPGVGRCSADFQDEGGSIYASASVTCP